MNNKKFRLLYLFDKYYKKTASSAEIGELFYLLNLDRHDRETTLLLKKAWDELQADTKIIPAEKSEAILNNILHKANQPLLISTPQSNPKSNLWLKLSIAASVLLVGGLTVFIKFKASDQTLPKHRIAKVETTSQHERHPVLKLSNGTMIVLDEAHKGLLSKQGGVEISKSKEGMLVFNTISHNTAKTVYSTIATPAGIQYQVVLPDGSKVWLNAASSLTFPSSFTGKTRNVQVAGEAYFEVAKNAKQPFVVQSGLTRIQVVGTHFNVRNYENESAAKTTLLEGGIRITDGRDENILKPGDQASIRTNSSMQIERDVNTAEITGWKNGVFVFDDATISEVLQEAARWYDLNIIYQGKIPAKKFTGTLPRKVKVDELLEMLRYTGVNLKADGKNIIVLNQ
ncbi:FecR domain-containing protein [Mucilaginibacter sp. Bleaf8]|uniref:FecR family protein n=1 Tax=Mucilaginibacter sp. Bleaf8 TaxID=2834430 RepID=UPI001BCB2E5E|nr:FecR domain-containing protein [Mucilaginibacter sp. Bleaf8]MBS7563891.1 FecR domain-containing protein [Mucilaginibacter sp. Bleaf8]